MTAEEGIAALLAHLLPDGPVPTDTPARVVRGYEEMTRGHHDDPGAILGTRFEPDPGHHYDELIMLGGVDYTALCEHHLLPFTGTATVAYLPTPGAAIVGLSKLARLIDCYTKRITIQERATQQITQALDDHLDTQGSAAILRSQHQCMTIRGVHKPQAIMTTSSMTGQFRNNAEARSELLILDRS